MLDEWGLTLDERAKESASEGGKNPMEFSQEAARDYVSSAFATIAQAKIPVSIMWKWSPGGKFNIWPAESESEDSIVKIITDSAGHFRPR